VHLGMEIALQDMALQLLDTTTPLQEHILQPLVVHPKPPQPTLPLSVAQSSQEAAPELQPSDISLLRMGRIRRLLVMIMRLREAILQLLDTTTPLQEISLQPLDTSASLQEASLQLLEPSTPLQEADLQPLDTTTPLQEATLQLLDEATPLQDTTLQLLVVRPKPPQPTQLQ